MNLTERQGDIALAVILVLVAGAVVGAAVEALTWVAT